MATVHQWVSTACFRTIFPKKVLAVLEAFCVVLIVVLRAISFELDKVFAFATY